MTSIAALAALPLHPDVVLLEPPQFVAGGHYRGAAEAERYFRRSRAARGELELVPEAFLDASERVVVLLRASWAWRAGSYGCAPSALDQSSRLSEKTTTATPSRTSLRRGAICKWAARERHKLPVIGPLIIETLARQGRVVALDFPAGQAHLASK